MMTTKTPYEYPNHPDGRRKKVAEMTDAEIDALLAAPLDEIPEDIRPKNLVVPGRFPGPRTNAWKVKK